MSYSDIKESLQILEKDIQVLTYKIKLYSKKRNLAQKQLPLFKRKELSFQKEKKSIENEKTVSKLFLAADAVSKCFFPGQLWAHTARGGFLLTGFLLKHVFWMFLDGF